VTDRAAFLAARKVGVGGSDVAAILGLSPFQTPLDIWRAKVLGDESDESTAMERGRRLEPYVLRAYADKANALLQQRKEPYVDGWRIGNVDMLAERRGWPRVVEAKTTVMDDWGEEGTDEVPVYYQTQGLWYLDLAALDECDFPVLVIPRDPRVVRDMLGLPPAEVVARIGVRIYTVGYNAAAVAHMRSECERFWHENVLPQVPPPPKDLDDAKRCWWSVEGKSVEATADVIEALRRYDSAREAEKAVVQEKERAQFELRRMLGDADGAVLGSRKLVTCKTTKRADGIKFRALRTTKDWETLKPQLLQETEP
jgi:putative phage-type endonuclease